MLFSNDKLKLLTPLILSAGLISACGGGGGGGGSSSGSNFALSVTDAPADDVDGVVVQFSQVALRPASSEESDEDLSGFQTFDLSPAIQLDLTEYTEGSSFRLLSASVPSGNYDEIRLIIDSQATDHSDSYVLLKDDMQRHDLKVPSGSASGLKLKNDFVIAAGQRLSLTIDFDLRKALTRRGGPGNPEFILRPSLRVVDNSEVGSIDGNVDTELVTACAEGDTEANTYLGTVYLFEEGQEADDIDGDSDPVVTAYVRQGESGDYGFRIGFVPAGAYFVSYTCDAANDDPEADDELSFTGESATFSVTEGETSTPTIEPTEEPPMEEEGLLDTL